MLRWFRKFGSSQSRLATSKNNFKRIKPILALLKILGVFPYGIGSKCVKASGTFEYALAIMSVCLFSLPIVVILGLGHIPMMGPEAYPPWAHLLDAVVLIKHCCLYAPILLDFLNCVFWNRQTIVFFERLAKWDEDATRFGIPREQKILKHWIFIVVFFMPHTWICSSFVKRYQSEEPTFFKDLPVPFLLFFHSCILLKWIIYVSMIYERFEHLKDSVVKYIVPATTILYSGTGRFTLENVAKLHRDLVTVVTIFNGLASLTLLMTFGALVPNSLLNMKLTDYAMNNPTVSAYATTSFVLLFEICFICSKAIMAASRIDKLFTTAENTFIDQSKLAERIVVATELAESNVAFSGGELFDVDMATFQGYCSFSFTFIIILMAFMM